MIDRSAYLQENYIFSLFIIFGFFFRWRVPCKENYISVFLVAECLEFFCVSPSNILLVFANSSLKKNYKMCNMQNEIRNFQSCFSQN